MRLLEPGDEPGTATEPSPTRNVCVSASSKSTTTSSSRPAAATARRRSSRGRPARRRVAHEEEPAARRAGQRPLADRGDESAAMQASTAFPPWRSTPAPASADSGWPAAIARRLHGRASLGERIGTDSAYRAPASVSPERRKLGSSSTSASTARRTGRAALERRRLQLACATPPRPVATTVTHTCPVSRESTVAPKMMLVSSVAVAARPRPPRAPRRARGRRRPRWRGGSRAHRRSRCR